MNVAVGETRENESSAGIDYFRSLAAHLLNCGIVADGRNFRASDSDGLGPRLFRILRVDPAVDHDDIGRLHSMFPSVGNPGSHEKDRKDEKRGANGTSVHHRENLSLRK